MCGIVGYVGPRPCVDLIVGGLRRLEYRGYDSAGVASLGAAGLDITAAIDSSIVARASMSRAIAACRTSTSVLGASLSRDGTSTVSRVAEIRETGRGAKGVRLVNLEEGDKLLAIAKVVEPAAADEAPAQIEPPDQESESPGT